MLMHCPTWPEEFAARYRANGLWQGQTLGEMLAERAVQQGDRIAVVSGESRYSYLELDQQANRLASSFLEIGLKPEDRVVVQLPNRYEFFTVIFALFRIGAIPVFALPLHRQSEIQYLCEWSEAVAYVIPDQEAGFDYRVLAEQVQSQVPTLQHIFVAGEPAAFHSLQRLSEHQSPSHIAWPPIKSNDVAFLQLSGGSTGLPKLIPRTHDDYIYSFRRSNEICGLTESSVYLAALPVAHNFPLSSPGVLGTLYAGGKIVLASSPSPDIAFPLIEKEHVTITALVPPLALIWMEAAASRANDLSSLQVLQVGGAKFSEEAARRVEPVLGCKLQQVYGMAEGLVNYTRLDDPEATIVTTQGRPMSDWDEIRIVDEEDNDVPVGEVGELLTRGPYTIRGYYRAEAHNAKAFTVDGFYRTGDLVKMNSEGYIVVDGRAKDQINRGGDKIAAEEVENHLLSHASVFDAALVSMPDSFLGERSCAFIIVRGQMTVSAAELKDYLRARGLAPYKIPDRIQFVDTFPQTNVGKVSKKALREVFATTVTNGTL
ncbi:(2,3-dihydroxybenzoyl)adenylate synthase [Paenibacillus pectinilyticus]|uniref:(2,3-dihydroxybenzoyl)adenylate synthase n=1 Tax=Paenibacillus pectinilyticus TaxID=512399 RepID=A0A1C0ZTW8_9BACL|nr:(2,3-dihydroxybenzoyl)adenylate synthase [Paenibacillus pectinilyticus]OCT11519.1 (2,3-dihydroxybenzoyl)adenylate synthase [Paenibacillus pectinilyticus]